MARSSGSSRKRTGKKQPEIGTAADAPTNLELFEDLPDQYRLESVLQGGIVPIWTQHKAQVIAKYIYLFTIITHHGAYIDGFAGPKNKDLPNSWAAELVINTEPRRLREFFLCDLDEKKVEALRNLVAQQRDGERRHYAVYPGDFNTSIVEVLGSGKIKDSTATFCLLDQFQIECHWSTLVALAGHKPEGYRKIELFYFFATGWMNRTLTGHTVNIRRPDLWWGDDSWKELISEPGNKLLTRMLERFRDELGYRFVRSYPIHEREKGRGKVMFHMIHASDHPEAHKLMARAHRDITQMPEPVQQGQFPF